MMYDNYSAYRAPFFYPFRRRYTRPYYSNMQMLSQNCEQPYTKLKNNYKNPNSSQYNSKTYKQANSQTNKQKGNQLKNELFQKQQFCEHQTQNSKKEQKEIKSFPSISTDEPLFEIFGIKLYFDDILLVCLIFFLYNEGVQDPYLFIALILLLLS